MTKARWLGAITVFLLAACAPLAPANSQAPSPPPGVDAGASIAPATASPATSPTATTPPDVPPKSPDTIDRSTTAGILPPDSIAIVMVDGLRVRENPSLGARRSGSLAKGSRVLISGSPGSLGPVAADGQTWYQVSHRDDGSDPATAIVGWAASGNAAMPFLATLKPRCENAGQVELTAYEQLACFGSGSVTLEGTYGCGECGGTDPGNYEPVWLASPLTPGFPVLRTKPGHGVGWITMHIPPDATIKTPVEGSIVRVIGHFDDPAADTCRITFGEDDTRQQADKGAAVLYCRERFVMDSYERIGTDPNYPAG